MKQIVKLVKIFKFPLNYLYARLAPVTYAKKLGVQMKGSVTIYGTSYFMFSAEPYLVTLGDNVFISIDASFVCHDGSTLPFRKDIPDLELAGEIIVGNNVFIGTKALILPGITIGNNCVVGANSVVTKNVPDNCVVAGNPARRIKSIEDFLNKAQEKSLKIGHLSGKEKVAAYKRIFNK
jgi:carbonic anhydrase/acetyltransferase-like protein (isoleucine patch superfamily)